METKENNNPNMHEENDNENEALREPPEEPDETDAAAVVSEAEDEASTETKSTRRSTQATRPIERLEPNMSGKSYMQQTKNGELESETDTQYRHNLFQQAKPNASQNKEYSPSDAMLMARLINDLNSKATREGASFAQQYLLNKGLKVFGQKGREASKKEVDQLHRRSCFTPILIAEMTPTERRKAQQALMFLLGEK